MTVMEIKPLCSSTNLYTVKPVLTKPWVNWSLMLTRLLLKFHHISVNIFYSVYSDHFSYPNKYLSPLFYWRFYYTCQFLVNMPMVTSIWWFEIDIFKQSKMMIIFLLCQSIRTSWFFEKVKKTLNWILWFIFFSQLTDSMHIFPLKLICNNESK